MKTKELREEIIEILKSEWQVSLPAKLELTSAGKRTVEQLEALFQAKEEEVVERIEIELKKYSCGKHKKLFKLLASLKK